MKPTIPLAAALALLVACVAAPAGERVLFAAPPAVYTQECASCHLAYPPGLLPADSWQRMMDSLPRHFGTDASLDAATRNTIAAWLAANAGTGKRARGAPPDDRITRADWFVREHREVPAAAWSRASIRSASNCADCHDGAADGRFDEHGVRIPR